MSEWPVSAILTEKYCQNRDFQAIYNTGWQTVGILGSDKVHISRYTYWCEGTGGNRTGDVAPYLPAPRCSNEENVWFLKRA
jgi:hypothetical protein